MNPGQDSDFSSPDKPWRLRFIAIAFLLAFLAVMVRLFMVQIVHSADYRERARKQYEARVDLRPTRGLILDRAGRTIASTVQSVSYAVDPHMLENADRVCRALEHICGIPKDQLLAKIQSNKDKNFVWLARGFTVSSETTELDTISDAGFIRLSEPKRNYLYGSMAAQLVGCTNVDNKGLAGLELAYDSLLQGQSGFEVMQRDGRGRLRQVIGATTKAARNGYSLELTIDAELQSIVEQELQRGIEKAGAASGIAIAMNPHTAEILSIASWPSYNPNTLKESTPDAMRLRGLCDMYEPGSTFKMITAAAAIESKLVMPNSMVDGMGGEMKLKDGTIVRDHEALGQCTLETALEKSSNIVFGNLARSIPDESFYKITRDFGFGIPLGMEISGEAKGILKTPREYDYSTKLFMGYGYQLAATALQMVNAYATVANNGVMMKPMMVKRILDENNAPVSETAPMKIRQVISTQTAQTLSNMFVSVVERGTGTEARINGLRIAGKTGTAQQLVNGKYSKEAYTASFIGYFPADSAEMVILVMLDRPKTDIYGGKTAAPIFRNIVQRILATPSVNESFPALSRLGKSTVVHDSINVPDLRGMECNDARRVLHEKGLRLNREDEHGIIVQQTPVNGTPVPPGTSIDVRLNSDHNPDQNIPNSPAPSNAPDVRGLSLRRAVAVLQANNIQVRIKGSGRVQSQVWTTEHKQRVCTLICR